VAVVKGYYEAEDGIIDKRVAIRARNYHIIDGNFYRKGVCAPLLKCISVTEGKQLLDEIHSDMCSHHIGTRALSGTALGVPLNSGESSLNLGIKTR
jgi:hypothetical protein